MITISLCMIVKDEEETLDRVLTSAKDIVDEIIIVDTGSTDKTKEIAQKYTNKIYDFVWCDDFSKARNYSFSKATCEYCMWLDADDVIPSKSKEALMRLKETIHPNTSVVMLPYHTAFDKDNNPTFVYYRERILRRKDHFAWEGFIHEVITPRGVILRENIPIRHHKIRTTDANRNLTIFTKNIAAGVQLNPREIFYYARELYYHKKYKEALTQFQAFIDTKKGWLENILSAYQLMAHCHTILRDTEAAIRCLITTFTWDIPRAEICCDLAKIYAKKQQYEHAVYWYKAALLCKKQESSGGFVLIDCYDFIPYIELCVCYYHLGDYTQSHHYNELAGKCKPNDTSYLSNKKFFSKFYNEAT